MTEDEELAEQMALRPPADTEPGVQMADWSPEMEALSLIVDRLGEVMRAVIATIPKAKVPAIKPMPRPRTAFDRVRQRRRVAKHRALVARVLPGQ